MRVINKGVVYLPPAKWSHPCDKFVERRTGSLRMCAVCDFGRHAHKRLIHCNACGGEFIALDGESNGFDMCDLHVDRRAI
jgi:hypothetical protein